MIIMKLNGGLGNQMFQYAYGRALQIRFQDELWLDTEEFRRTYGHEPRHYSLDAFSLSDSVKVMPIEACKTLLQWKVLQKLSGNLTSTVAEKFHVYWWRNSSYKDFNIKSTKNTKNYFYGYWQCEKYFDDIHDVLMKDFSVTDKMPDQSKVYLPEIEKKNSVCVHVRRGDFVSQGMIACDARYYVQGVQYILEKHVDANFLIFTDDIQWVKENITFDVPVTFVTIKDPDYEVLRLMRMCKHFVISNSSFSWWAQYLGMSENKIVVAPKVWHVNNPEERSIFMPEWVTL